jgi:predicted ATP-binding protein involved in virulence
MKVTSLKLENFRCFKELSVDFHEQLTVLVAPNGQGKSSVLDALRIALWPYVSAFDVVPGTMLSTGIEIDDVRLVRSERKKAMEPILPTRIETGFTYQGQVLQSARQRDKVSKGSRTSSKEAKALEQVGRKLQHQVRIHTENDTEANDEVVLPCVAFYGTGRLWKQRYLTLKKQSSSDFFSRTYAYVGCLDSGSDYKFFAEWFFHLYASDFEQKTKAMERQDYAGLVDEALPYAELMQCIRDAVNLVMKDQGWHNLSYSPSQKTLIMTSDDRGELKVDQLSDGLKSVVAMVADIAYRCVRLNVHLGREAARETTGVVIIDEVDMHLHPSWQQTIVHSLQEAFPRIQFIVTTHSPQVLSTVRRNNIRIIQSMQVDANTAEQPLGRTYGEPSGDVLHSVMSVDPRPPIDEKPDLQRLTELVDQGLYDCPEAVQLMQQLITTLGEQNAQLQRLQRSIQRQKVLGV